MIQDRYSQELPKHYINVFSVAVDIILIFLLAFAMLVQIIVNNVGNTLRLIILQITYLKWNLLVIH